MGAGKTSVGRALAKRLDWRFRGIERAILAEQVPTRHAVVATGGGTFVDPQNRAVIKADGAVVWLDAPIERLIARIPQDGRRPLASDRPTFERLFQSRHAAYEQAHLRLDAGRAG